MLELNKRAQALRRKLQDPKSFELSPQWLVAWAHMEERIAAIVAHAQSIGFQLGTRAELGSDAANALSQSILKHVPEGYSADQTERYAAEYIAALEDIRREMSGKKNLWDKFCDVLAGGVQQQQSPAERVMLMRWLEGDLSG